MRVRSLAGISALFCIFQVEIAYFLAECVRKLDKSNPAKALDMALLGTFWGA